VRQHLVRPPGIAVHRGQSALLRLDRKRAMGAAARSLEAFRVAKDICIDSTMAQ
jgi:hypothetical protein